MQSPLQNISPFQRLVATTAAMAILIAALAAGILCLAQRVYTFRRELIAAEANVVTAEANRVSTKRASAILKENEAGIARIERFFIDREQPVEFIERLEAVARATRNKISLNVNEAGNGANSLSFRVRLEGTAASVRTMLHALELLPYQLSIDEIAFTQSETGWSAVGNAPPLGAPATLSFLISVKTL